MPTPKLCKGFHVLMDKFLYAKHWNSIESILIISHLSRHTSALFSTVDLSPFIVQLFKSAGPIEDSYLYMRGARNARKSCCVVGRSKMSKSCLIPLQIS